MLKQIDNQVSKRIKIISKPKGGLDFKTWSADDVSRWWQLIAANHYSRRDIADIKRLKKKYKLEKYYLFSMQ